jgi:cytochrome c peroxidase
MVAAGAAMSVIDCTSRPITFSSSPVSRRAGIDRALRGSRRSSGERLEGAMTRNQWVVAGAVSWAALACVGQVTPEESIGTEEAALLEELFDSIPNNVPIPNGAGAAATFSTEGFVDLADEFHTPQGTNGRHCATCHAVESGWSITPLQIQLLFALTGGTHPIFNTLDAGNPAADITTVEARRRAYRLLLTGLFRRGGAPVAGADYVILAADDPAGFGSTSRFSFFRRPLATANLHLITGLMWDDRLTVAGDARPPRAGLFSQARGNITGAQQGPVPPDALVDAIVDDELELWVAQVVARGIRLDSCGARGGPEHLAGQGLVSGRWDLFDAWIGLAPGACSSPSADRKRVQIARGQEIFNERLNARGGRCRGCHDAVNNGTNVAGQLFDIRTSAAERRPDGHPLYTLQNLTTGEIRQTTDPGKAFVTGRWSDMDRFKAPTLRGLSARAPYFHNGIAATLRDVVRHYDEVQGFGFTEQEEDDLVAFLEAL